jgi:hypothetical protein
MLTRLRALNFKQFETLDIELGNPVVFIGPNDSGKTTALQALALWGLGLTHWISKYESRKAPKRRPAVTINRRDLLAIPVPAANQLWRDLHTRAVTPVAGGPQTKNIRIDVIVNGINDDQEWECGFEFDYANSESIYCRALREGDEPEPARMPVPDLARSTRIAYLPPMSGLAANESRLMEGAVNVRIGEGRTAEVLRNLCFQILESENGQERWRELVARMVELFGVELTTPVLIEGRGEIAMSFRTRSDVELDLSASGRGMQQTVLLLAYLMANPRSVLLLDEPDAHLEILRQREIYNVLSEAARGYGSQVVAASHSEVILKEAAGRDVVVAFVGRKPHRIDDRGAQVLKSLESIRFEDYYQAEITGWLIYLEGATDLAILRAFAAVLNHDAQEDLERPFVLYVGNQAQEAHRHFHGLREAKADLAGYALFDRLDTLPPGEHPSLAVHCWQKREIENYLASREVLLTWARETGTEREGPLFGAAWEKSNYHELARYVSPDTLDGEVREVLDGIHAVAQRARPRE